MIATIAEKYHWAKCTLQGVTIEGLPGLFTLHTDDLDASADREIVRYQTQYVQCRRNDDGTYSSTLGAWATIDPVEVKAALMAAFA